MMKPALLLVLMLSGVSVYAQEPRTYTNADLDRKLVKTAPVSEAELAGFRAGVFVLPPSYPAEATWTVIPSSRDNDYVPFGPTRPLSNGWLDYLPSPYYAPYPYGMPIGPAPFRSLGRSRWTPPTPSLALPPVRSPVIVMAPASGGRIIK